MIKVTLPYQAEVRVTLDLDTGVVERAVVIGDLWPDPTEHGYYLLEPPVEDPVEREELIARALEHLADKVVHINPRVVPCRVDAK